MSALIDKAVFPTDELLLAALVDSKLLWDGILKHITATYKLPSTEWKHYGKAAGWSLAVFSGKRRLVNMVPLSGYFQVVFSFSEKAAALGRSLGLPVPDDKDCVCGYGFNFDVKTSADIDTAQKLLEIKDKN
jgi:hypothetical protein